jgi:hypothetical protein
MKNLELIFKWLGIQFIPNLWWIIPLLFIGVAFWVSRSPKSWFGKVFLDKHFEARNTDYANEKGPILEDKHKEYLRALLSSNNKVMEAKNTTLYWSNKWYKQKSLHTNGFDRALLIAFIYPIFAIFISWLFDSGPLQLGGVFLSKPLPFGIKILLIVLPIACFFWMKIAPSWFSKKITALNTKSSWVKSTISKFSEGIGFWIAVAVAVAGAVAVAVAGAVAVSGALAFAGAFAGAFAVFIAVFIAFAVAFESIFETVNKCYKKGFKRSLFSIFVCFIYILTIAFCVINTPNWLARFFALNIELSESSFLLGFFFCLLPLVNGFSDWLSVSFTQFCLNHYSAKGSSKWYVWLFFDLCLALIFTVILFFSLFLLLDLMQLAGWAVDSGKIKSEIYADIENASSIGDVIVGVVFEHFWLFGLIITNLAPTCVHLIFVVKAHIVGYFSPIRNDIEDLLIKAKVIAAPHANYDEDYFKWSAVEAEKVALYVSGLPRVNALVFASLVIPFLYLIFLLTTSVIAWLVN